jgi:hypothetical protein
VDSLGIMLIERPQTLLNKKKHFFASYEIPDSMRKHIKKIRNLYFELEQMRLHAEIDRITYYKNAIEKMVAGNIEVDMEQIPPRLRSLISD